MANQGKDLILAHRSLPDQAESLGLGQDGVGIEPLAVVDDVEDEVGPHHVGLESDRTGLALAETSSFLRAFQAVVDGVADHVFEGIAQTLDDGLVHLEPLALEGELRHLSQGKGEVADDAAVDPQGRADGDLADAHDLELQAAGVAIQPGQHRSQFLGGATGELVGDLKHVGLHDHHLPDGVEELAETGRVHPDRVLGLSGLILRGFLIQDGLFGIGVVG